MSRVIPLTAIALGTILLSSPASVQAQAPVQRYGDWTRLDFRPQEYQYRRNRIMEYVAESGGGIMLVPSSDGRTEGSTFRQLDDFWYFTGLEIPNSMLAFDVVRRQSILFMPKQDERFHNPGRPNDFPGRPLLSDFQIRGMTGIDQYMDIDQLEVYVKGWIDTGRLIRLNAGRPGEIEPVTIPLVGDLDPIQTLDLRLRAENPAVRISNAYEQVARLRMIKSPREIRAMEIAAEVTSEGIRRAAAAIRPGRDERSLQGIFEETCRSLGSQSTPFTPIVKAGPNSLWAWRILAAHYDRRNRPMEDGELVILDVGCEVDGYISDVGRTFPVGGTFSELQREKLEMSTGVADAIIAAVRPGVTFADLMEVALEAIPDEEERYMQTPSFFGHHIGMSAGDPALEDEPLAEGMIFTVEPWYYNHDEGISVFVEDVILVTADGAEVMTARLPRTPDQLEALMR